MSEGACTRASACLRTLHGRTEAASHASNQLRPAMVFRPCDRAVHGERGAGEVRRSGEAHHAVRADLELQIGQPVASGRRAGGGHGVGHHHGAARFRPVERADRRRRQVDAVGDQARRKAGPRRPGRSSGFRAGASAAGSHCRGAWKAGRPARRRRSPVGGGHGVPDRRDHALLAQVLG